MKAAADDDYETFLTLRMADSDDPLATDARLRRAELRN